MLLFSDTQPEIRGDNHLVLPGELQVDTPSLSLFCGQSVEIVLRNRLLC